jgi:mono/diheme cytochrome c family protein
VIAALPATAQSEDEGASLYGENCQSCHQPGGIGLEGAFPPLAGNPNVDDAAHVADVLRNGLTGPIEVGGVTYDGVMPAFPQLSDTQIESLVIYLQGLGEPPADGSTTTTVPAGPVAGDPDNGELLFTGSVQLAGGGPACHGCHVAGPVTGGGTLGPDLTDVLSRLGGAAGVSGWLANPASPTMQPIYATAPLTEAEITDLTAFLAETQGTTPPSGPDSFLVGGVAGLAVLVGAVALVSRGRRMTYADRLRSRS